MHVIYKSHFWRAELPDLITIFLLARTLTVIFQEIPVTNVLDLIKQQTWIS
jgi:hypothetical protein